ncbi:MAG: ABC transporter permease [Lachnospiraceae bacterium]|nr:ABC transporter permease [Lachnospiraceae bacterium]
MQHTHISAKHRLLDLHLKEVWQYRGLIWLFTKRSFVVAYTQTILGPLWLVIAPLLTSVVHVVLFGNIAKLGTDGVPQLLFYLTGNALWGYFSACVTKCSATFTGNAGLFGKVYFPRLVVPLSDVLGNALRFCIQMLPALALLVYYRIHGMLRPRFSAIWIVPALLVLLGLMGMGLGIIISSLTTKYRDLSVLVGFGMSLWMYATPVVYPLSTLSGAIRELVLLNPVTQPMELFRWALLGVGSVSPSRLVYSLWVTVVLVFGGIMVFNRVERTFLDTV